MPQPVTFLEQESDELSSLLAKCQNYRVDKWSEFFVNDLDHVVHPSPSLLLLGSSLRRRRSDDSSKRRQLRFGFSRVSYDRSKKLETKPQRQLRAESHNGSTRTGQSFHKVDTRKHTQCSVQKLVYNPSVHSCELHVVIAKPLREPRTCKWFRSFFFQSWGNRFGKRWSSKGCNQIVTPSPILDTTSPGRKCCQSQLKIHFWLPMPACCKCLSSQDSYSHIKKSKMLGYPPLFFGNHNL